MAYFKVKIGSDLPASANKLQEVETKEEILA